MYDSLYTPLYGSKFFEKVKKVQNAIRRLRA